MYNILLFIPIAIIVVTIKAIQLYVTGKIEQAGLFPAQRL
jgi:hypothetical protein